MIRSLSRLQLGVDIALAGVFLLVFWVIFGAVDGISLAQSAGVALLLAAAVAVRRLSPVAALVGAWLAAVLQMALGLTPIPVDVGIFVVLYATAAYGTTLVFWLGFASSFVGAATIAVYMVFARPFTQGLVMPSWSEIPIALSVLVAATFGLLLAWTAGALVRALRRGRRIRLAQQQAEERAAVEEERLRIARDMHDIVAHSLAVVIAQADGARYAAAADPDAPVAALATIGGTARAALADVRMLLTQLRHSEGQGPQPTLADLEQLYAQVRAAGVALAVDVDPAPPADPPAGVQLAVYRIFQEALTNALRHGDGGPVSVRLSWGPEAVEASVVNAVPRGAEGAPAGGGHGILGMQERAQLVGGSVTAGPDRGVFTVRASLPVGGSA